jgi:hypothetical protein
VSEARAANHGRDLAPPHGQRLAHVASALCAGMTADEMAEATGYDLWFVAQMRRFCEVEEELTIVNCQL